MRQHTGPASSNSETLIFRSTMQPVSPRHSLTGRHGGHRDLRFRCLRACGCHWCSLGRDFACELLTEQADLRDKLLGPLTFARLLRSCSLF